MDNMDNMDKLLNATFIVLIGVSIGIVIENNGIVAEAFSAAPVLMALFALIFRRRFLKKWTPLSESPTLFDASVFWCVIFLFGTISLIYLWFELTTPKNLETHQHFAETIYTYLKKPVLIFGTSLPLIALIANHHRSHQTDKQIKSTQKQIQITQDNNNFTNHIKHFELFKRQLKTKQPFSYIDGKPNEQAIYRSIYRDSSNGILRTSDTFNTHSKNLKDSTLKIRNETESLKQSYTNDHNGLAEDLDNLIYDICINFSIDLKHTPTLLSETAYQIRVIEIITATIEDLSFLANFILESKAQLGLAQSVINLSATKRHLEKAP